MSGKKVAVIGAGIAGMAVAIRLRKSGHKVTVYESAPTYGGKIKEYRWSDFRFDTGPSLFTLPELVDELFILCGKDPRLYFHYKKLKKVTKYFFEEGIVIDSFSDPHRFAEEVSHKLHFPAPKMLAFLKNQRNTYDLLAPVFLQNSIHHFKKLIKLSNLSALLRIMDPRFLFSMNKINAHHFKNKYLVRLFNRYGTYNGSNPYRMPSLFNIISHLEHNLGAYLPEKGMRSIADVIYNLAVEEGVSFEFNTYINEIKCHDGAATSLMVNGKEIAADYMVSNMDVNNTFAKLLPDVKPPKAYLENEKSTSALIFHWAIKGSFPLVDVHNILFAKNYEEEFAYLFGHKKLYHDPTIYLYISSKIVKGDAPENNENWFVMINTPHLNSDQNWDVLKDEARAVILDKIEKYLGYSVRESIIHEHSITPVTLANTTHSYLGSLYGASSNSLFSAFMRHPNFSKVKNLYFCGGSVHPGGGIPLCLFSAKITAGLINDKITAPFSHISK